MLYFTERQRRYQVVTLLLREKRDLFGKCLHNEIVGTTAFLVRL